MLLVSAWCASAQQHFSLNIGNPYSQFCAAASPATGVTLHVEILAKTQELGKTRESLCYALMQMQQKGVHQWDWDWSLQQHHKQVEKKHMSCVQ